MELKEKEEKGNPVALAQEKYGYKLDKRKSCKAVAVLHSEGIPGAVDESLRAAHTIAVYKQKSTGAYVFYNVQHPADKGSIQHFEQGRERDPDNHFRYEYSGKEAKKYNLEGQDFNFSTDRNQVVNYALRCENKIDDRSYFYQNGITDQTLNSPEFKGSLHQRDIEVDGLRQKEIVVPMADKSGSLAGAFSCTHPSSNSGQHSSVIIAGDPKHKGQIDRVVVTDHIMNAMAYHQLNPPKPGERVVYISTSPGHVSPKQAQIIATYAAKAGKVVLAMPEGRNEVQHMETVTNRMKVINALHSQNGQQVNAYFPGGIASAREKEQWEKRQQADPYLAPAVIGGHFTDKEQRKAFNKVVDTHLDNQGILEKITNYVKEKLGLQEYNEFSVHAKKMHDRTVVKLDFTPNKENYEKLESALLAAKGLSSKVEIARPKGVSFWMDVKQENRLLTDIALSNTTKLSTETQQEQVVRTVKPEREQTENRAAPEKSAAKSADQELGAALSSKHASKAEDKEAEQQHSKVVLDTIEEKPEVAKAEEKKEEQEIGAALNSKGSSMSI